MQDHKIPIFNINHVSLYNINMILRQTTFTLAGYNFKVGNVMNHLSFKTGVDSYLSVLVVAMHAFLAVVAVGTLLSLLGAI